MATREEIAEFMAAEFPHTRFVVTSVGEGKARVSLATGPNDLRPGGTISGPTLMSVADLALYVAVLGEIGIVPLAVTTSLSINFLRKPSSGSKIIGECSLLKLGKSLAVGEVWLYSDGKEDPVAHAVGTYSIPPSARS